MRKLYVGLLGSTVSVILLLSAVAPVFAGEPRGDSNPPVIWVESTINTGGDLLPTMHTNHAMTVRMLRDGTVFGNVENHFFTSGVDNGEGEYPGLGTFFDCHFWQEGGAKFAEICVVLVNKETGNPVVVKYLICDNGKTGENDWHSVWAWMR